MSKSRSTPEPAPPAAPQRFAGLRTWLRQNRRLVLIGATGLCFIVITFATLDYFIAPTNLREPPTPKLETAFELLDNGQFIAAREAAERIQSSRKLQPTDYGAPAYIIGASLLLEADETIDPGDRAQRFRVASRYLQRAQDRGFPKGREGEGLLILGRSLHESGQYAQSIAALADLEKQNTPLKPTAQRLLASCHLRSDPPKLDKAIAYAEAVLSAPELAPGDRESALLLYGETLLMQRQFARCAELVEQIPSSSKLFPQAMLFKGRSLLAAAQSEQVEAENTSEEAAAVKALYIEAIDALRQAHSRHAANHQVAREASYLIGVALQQSGNQAAAQAQFLRVRKVYYQSPEGIAASLLEADIALAGGDFDGALLCYQQAIDQVKAAPMLVNPWISPKELHKRIERGYQQFLDNHRYALASKLAESLSPLVSQERSLELMAAVHEHWGAHLAHAAEADTTVAGRRQQAAAREQYRAAANDYARLAELRRATRRYTNDVWRAGQNFAAGRDYQRAVELYRIYLREESKRERPAVLVKLGEALLSLDRVDEAIAAFQECISAFPKDPAAYHARLFASRAYLEKNDLAQAKVMLQANLHHESLTPRSDVWRESLFAMGRLLHDEGLSQLIAQNIADKKATNDTASVESAHATLHEALRYLREAVERYPEDRSATLARLQLAEAHRQAARLPLARLQNETIESRRAALIAQAQQELKAALATYEELTTLLNRRGDVAPLSAVEQSILRNAYFARGGVLYDLGEFEQAIQAYSTATNRYQNEPAAVEAYVQIASCYRRLNKPLEARGTIEQAKIVIDRMPSDVDFTKTTRFARDEWNTLLNWLSGT